jgi:hypothetical protein
MKYDNDTQEIRILVGNYIHVLVRVIDRRFAKLPPPRYMGLEGWALREIIKIKRIKE